MATKVLTNAYLLVNSVDLSDHVDTIELTEGVEAQDATAMGAAATKIYNPGLLTGALKVTFQQDYASSKVDQTLSPLLSGRTVHAVEVRSDTGARSTTNPAWTFNAFLTSYQPVAGGVGQEQKSAAEWALNGAITRATA